MRKITKGQPPASFSDWVSQKPDDKDEYQWFEEIYTLERWDVLSDLAHHNAQEQFYLCAYCCDRINGLTGINADTMNEHVEARSTHRSRSLDHTNIVASCKTKHQCDSAHKNQFLPLTPLMDECETEFKFKISGRVEGLTDRAKEAIRVLNLGDDERHNRALIEKRKQLSHDLMLYTHGLDPEERLEDEQLLQSVIDDLLTPQDGKLEPFAPVVANILRNWINS